MIKRSVALYSRHDRVFIHPMAYSEMGLLIAVEPFKEIEKISTASEIRELLNIEFGRVPHPKKWDLLDPLIQMAGAKNWKDFGAKSHYLTIDLNDGIIRIKEGEWDGKGFSTSGETTDLASTCLESELQKCLDRLIG